MKTKRRYTPFALMDIIMSWVKEIQYLFRKARLPKNPDEMKEFEKNISRACNRLKGLLTRYGIKKALENIQFTQNAVAEARDKSKKKLVNRGIKFVKITLIGGVVLKIKTVYMSINRKGKRGRKRKKGRRGENGSGFYPALAQLGIFNRVTPYVQECVAKAASECRTFKEAQARLADMGICMDEKTIRNIAYSYGDLGLSMRPGSPDAEKGMPLADESMEGKTVVIQMDGGRVRQREGGRRGRRSKKTSRRRFNPKWREPRVIAVCTTDENGRKNRKEAAFYDSTMGKCQDVFLLLVGYLLALQVHKASRVVFVADGAHWIWNRLDELCETASIPAEIVYKILDFYHACEYLKEIADLCAKWSQKRRKRWFKAGRKLLKQGKIDELIEIVKELSRSQNCPEILEKLNYLINNKDRMQYAHALEIKIPIGSGVVESAVRRIINLRLKGNSIYWNPENLERMLFLRAYLISGNWEKLNMCILWKIRHMSQYITA